MHNPAYFLGDIRGAFLPGLTPIALKAGAYKWTGFGPFDLQVCRILLYFCYFIAGAAVTYKVLTRQLLDTGSFLHGKWKAVGLAGLAVFAVFLLIQRSFWRWDKMEHVNIEIKNLLEAVLYPVACGLLSLFFVMLFSRFGNHYRKWIDSFSANGYLIYFLHFPLVIWCQFILKGMEMHAIIKFISVAVVTLALSWVISSQLRRTRFFMKYV